jgi:hypothetical protein
MSGFAANGKGSDEAFGTTGRANSGSTFGPRGRINFIQGANVSISVSEDAPTEELRVTISASAPSAGVNAGIANGTVMTNGSGNYAVANQPGNLKWGACFAGAALTAGGGIYSVSFGSCSGTGSAQGHSTISSTGAANNSNGLLWSDAAGNSGATITFSGSTWTISNGTQASYTVAVCATGIGWN